MTCGSPVLEDAAIGDGDGYGGWKDGDVIRGLASALDVMVDEVLTAADDGPAWEAVGALALRRGERLFEKSFFAVGNVVVVVVGGVGVGRLRDGDEESRVSSDM
jgi:hypothetical protein